MRAWLFVASAAVAAAALSASCLNDFDRFNFGEGGAGATVPAVGGGNAGGGGSGGSPAECTGPLDCPGLNRDCRFRVCSLDGKCGYQNGAVGTTCNDIDLPNTCPDATGGCVCDGLGLCIASTCDDGVKSGDETNVDCGGTLCPGCSDLLDCLLPGDCLSGFCDDGSGSGGGGGTGGAGGGGGNGGTGGILPSAGQCAPCSGDAQCLVADTWCDLAAPNSGTCAPQKDDGIDCAAANECLSGFCVDDGNGGTCCDSACSGNCDVCDMDEGASADGTCTLVVDGDPGIPACAGGYFCNGATAACPTTCAAGGDCASTFCSDTRCCNEACIGVCRSCNLGGLEGTCSNIATGTTPAIGECANGCCNAGACGTMNCNTGQACDAPGDCTSNLCPVDSCN